MFGWDEGKKFLALPYLLTGKAESICEKLQVKTESKHILEALRDGCKVSVEVLLDRFFERKPEPGELLSAFARALSALLTKAMPDLANKEKEIFLRRQIGTYLPEHMRALIHFNSHKTWDELLGAIDQAMPHTKAGASAGAAACETFGGHRSDYPAGISIKADMVDVNSVDSTPGFRGSCNYCKEPGHMKVDCSKARAATARNGNQSRSNHQANSNSNGPTYRNSNNNSYSNNRDSSYKPSGNQSYRGDRDRNSQRSERPNDRGMGAKKHVNVMELQADSDSDDFYDDCTEHNIISVDVAGVDVAETPVLDLMSVSARVPLLKRATYVTFSKSNVTFKMKALFDGGAMCSFLQLTSLPVNVRNQVTRYLAGEENALSLRSESVIIRGATSEVTENCAIATVELKIGDWTGKHSFIISDKLGDKEMIIGRDFLKQHHVIVDHGLDKITIRKPVKFNNEKELEPMPITEVNGILIKDLVVAPCSEVVVKCHTSSSFAGKDLVFTPKANEIGTYWSNSVDTVDSHGNIRLSVINLNNRPLKMKAGTYLGYGSTNFEIVPDSVSIESKLVDVGKSSGKKDVDVGSSVADKLS